MTLHYTLFRLNYFLVSKRNKNKLHLICSYLYLTCTQKAETGFLLPTCSYVYVFLSRKTIIHSTNIVSTLLHVYEMHVHTFNYPFPLFCVLTHLRLAVSMHVHILFYFPRTAGEDKKLTKIKMSRNLHCICFFITILHHITPYSKERRPDAAECIKLSEGCLSTTSPSRWGRSDL